MAMSAQQGQRRVGVVGRDRSADRGGLARFARRVENELRDLRRADRIRRTVKGRQP
jgi:hypothetical protein